MQPVNQFRDEGRLHLLLHQGKSLLPYLIRIQICTKRLGSLS